MGSSISAINDDIDHYHYLCKKHKEKYQDLYGSHHDWIKKLDEGKTKLSYVEYKRKYDKEEKLRKIEYLKREIKQLEQQLKDLQK